MSNSNNFNIIRINHIAIASDNPSDLNNFFKDVLLLNAQEKEKIDSEGVVVSNYVVEKTAIEVLESISENSKIKKFIDKNKTAFHHISLEVDNIYSAINHFKNKDIRVIYDPPIVGASKMRATFLHPSDACGLLIEISQKINVK